MKNTPELCSARIQFPTRDGQGQRHLRHLRLPRDVVRQAQEAEAPRRPHRVRQDGAAGCAPA
eukprot:2229534-Prymnesium_polylepis.1